MTNWERVIQSSPRLPEESETQTPAHLISQAEFRVNVSHTDTWQTITESNTMMIDVTNLKVLNGVKYSVLSGISFLPDTIHVRPLYQKERCVVTGWNKHT